MTRYAAYMLSMLVIAALTVYLRAPAPIAAEAQPMQGVAAAPQDAREAWAVDVLARLGNTQPDADMVAFVVAWQAGEGTAAAFNPLATTQPAPGDTCFNYLSGRCGVRNYPDYETGMRATVETITNGYYPNILAGLQTNDPERALNDVELGVWGTGGANVRALYRGRQ